MRLVSENKKEIESLENRINALLEVTNSALQEMAKLDIEPTKNKIIELKNKTCKTYLEDVALSNLLTPVEGLKTEALRNLLDIPYYLTLQREIDRLELKYFNCIEIKKGVAKINKNQLEKEKDLYRTYARTQKELEVLDLLEKMTKAFNDLDSDFERTLNRTLVQSGLFNWKKYLRYNHYDTKRFKINTALYNELTK
jgi:hypothetical protein